MILVVGDVLLDIHHGSKTYRKAPEADIPIYHITHTQYILGGAANVAVNLQQLCPSVEILSVVGDDASGKIVRDLFTEKKVKHRLWVDKRKTTQKNRIFCENNIVNRFDVEDTMDIHEDMEQEILDYVSSIPSIDAIVFSDYNKGFLTDHLCRKLILYCHTHAILTFVDPKIQHIEKYENCFCLKPNMMEARLISGETEMPLIFNTLFRKLCPQNIVITHSDQGVYVNGSSHLYNHKIQFQVQDVTGAGDVFLAVLTSEYIKNKDIHLSSKIANYIASKSVECFGNYTIQPTDVEEFYLYENTTPYGNVVYEKETEKLRMIRRVHPKITFTNGCFDVFHSTHLKLLQHCKEANDGILMVGLNSDESIRTLKGETRPINPLKERIELLLHLRIIDFIVVFDSETPLNLLDILRPHVLVKGGDYNLDAIVGKEYCDEVQLFQYIEGISSTQIINRCTKTI